ncbi:MAG: cryptochrome/photolyase family protein [Salibacteraceae bacterium]
MKKGKQKVSVFWFRRDLRLEDNTGLIAASKGGEPVLPIFIFDDNILDEIPSDDPRVGFIFDNLQVINNQLNKHDSALLCLKGNPLKIWSELMDQYDISGVYSNKDYEPYAVKRDNSIEQICEKKGVPFYQFKDQVIFEKDEIVKDDRLPYTVYTPYKNKWRKHFNLEKHAPAASPINLNSFQKKSRAFPTKTEFGFKSASILVKPFQISQLSDYEETRNFPAKDSTSYLSPHLRFGTVSVRYLIRTLFDNETFINELIWREFFMQILYHFPRVINQNFKVKYNAIKWRNDPDEFEKWKNGQTGYPIVDAGMRELNATGYMHNRVRMVVAGFLCKHLLIDWRWGEAYFAERLLDYDLSANNGNWQWAAGTGCDAAPYFRVFNPTEQVKKFDAQLTYINKWVPELNTLEYPKPIVEHKLGRERAISIYKEGLSLMQ